MILSNHPALPIRVISHNIRYATSSPFPGELPWADRRRGLIAELLYHTRRSGSSPFVCLQEVLHRQLEDILAELNAAGPDHWSHVGVGRSDGKTAGEYSPILFRTSDWTLLEHSTVWLSETPDRPSKSWDAASIRILNLGIFCHNDSGRVVLAMNTHLDDQGSTSREEAARIILEVLGEKSARGRRFEIDGAFLAGDLNSETEQEAYRVLNSEGSGLRDVRRLLCSSGQGSAPTAVAGLPGEGDEAASIPDTSGLDNYGDENTYTGFGEDSTEAIRIDFIHVGTESLARREGREMDGAVGEDGFGPAPWVVEGYSVLPNKFEDGVYISDHRAVVGDLLLLA